MFLHQYLVNPNSIVVTYSLIVMGGGQIFLPILCIKTKINPFKVAFPGPFLYIGNKWIKEQLAIYCTNDFQKELKTPKCTFFFQILIQIRGFPYYESCSATLVKSIMFAPNICFWCLTIVHLKNTKECLQLINLSDK